MCVWGCLAKARSYKSHEGKLLDIQRQLVAILLGTLNALRGRNFINLGNKRFLKNFEFWGEGNIWSVVFDEETSNNLDRVFILIIVPKKLPMKLLIILFLTSLKNKRQTKSLPRAQPIVQTQQPQMPPLWRSTRERINIPTTMINYFPTENLEHQRKNNLTSFEKGQTCSKNEREKREDYISEGGCLRRFAVSFDSISSLHKSLEEWARWWSRPIERKSREDSRV